MVSIETISPTKIKVEIPDEVWLTMNKKDKQIHE